MKPDFKELRRLAKDSSVLLRWVDDYEELWETQSFNQKVPENE